MNPPTTLPHPEIIQMSLITLIFVVERKFILKNKIQNKKRVEFCFFYQMFDYYLIYNNF